LIIERIERENATGLLHIIKEEFDDWPIFDQYIEQEIISNEKNYFTILLKKINSFKVNPFFSFELPDYELYEKIFTFLQDINQMPTEDNGTNILIIVNNPVYIYKI
jgi:hypothetical protein